MISKFLLDHILEKDDVIAFRPGGLRNPYPLPQSLQSTGYYFSSSVTANNSLTHLPFQLNYNREHESELDIFEFPITIEDEALPKMGDRLPQAIEIADKLKEYGGTFIVLIHPDILDHKLEFEKGFINHVKDYAWFGTISEYGKWWSARNQVELNVESAGEDIVVIINAPEAIDGLTLNIPDNYYIKPASENNSILSQTGNKIIIKHVKGKFQLELTPLHTRRHI